jgi:hypothetical protein
MSDVNLTPPWGESCMTSTCDYCYPPHSGSQGADGRDRCQHCRPSPETFFKWMHRNGVPVTITPSTMGWKLEVGKMEMIVSRSLEEGMAATMRAWEDRVK